MQDKKDSGRALRGAWMLDTSCLRLHWAGEMPAPKATLRERVWMAWLFLKEARGVQNLMKRLAKATAFVLKPGQVVSSGNPYETVGLSLEEEWTGTRPSPATDRLTHLDAMNRVPTNA